MLLHRPKRATFTERSAEDDGGTAPNPISLLEGEMPGRAEGGIQRTNPSNPLHTSIA
jgi:hypothetical protein